MDFFNTVFIVVVFESMCDVQKYVLMLLLQINDWHLALATCAAAPKLRRKTYRFEITIQQSQLYYIIERIFFYLFMYVAMMLDCIASY